MKYKKIIAVTLSSIILLFSILFLISDKRNYSEMENRNLEQTPKFSLDRLFNGNYTNKLNNYFSDQFPGREKLVNIKTVFEKLTLKTKINGVYLAKDNYLIEEFYNEKNEAKIASSLNEFYKKIPYVNLNLMIVPNSIVINKDKLPMITISDNQLHMINNIYSLINFNKLDIYDTLLEHNKDYQMFYYLDHHWTTYAAYYAYLEYCKYNSISGYKITDFNIEKITDDFKGTLYSKVIPYNKKSDSIYLFKNDNNLKVEYVSSKKITNTLYELDYLNKKDKYSLFLDNNHPLIIITNNDIITNKEIFVIKDSYGNSLIPFLVNHFKKVHVIDPRYYKLSISDYIKNHEYMNDGLILYNANTINNDIGVLGIE